MKADFHEALVEHGAVVGPSNKSFGLTVGGILTALGSARSLIRWDLDLTSTRDAGRRRRPTFPGCGLAKITRQRKSPLDASWRSTCPDHQSAGLAACVCRRPLSRLGSSCGSGGMIRYA